MLKRILCGFVALAITVVIIFCISDPAFNKAESPLINGSQAAMVSYGAPMTFGAQDLFNGLANMR
jgi:hypothetical protein